MPQVGLHTTITSLILSFPFMSNTGRLHKNGLRWVGEGHDRLGISYKNHPHLKCIFMPGSWIKCPFHKDFIALHQIQTAQWEIFSSFSFVVFYLVQDPCNIIYPPFLYKTDYSFPCQIQTRADTDTRIGDTMKSRTRIRILLS